MDTANRVVWTIIGVLLLAAGAAVAAAGFGAVPRLDRDTALLAPALLARWRTWQPWSWWAVIVAGLLVATLGLALARSQVRRRGGPALDDLTDADLPAPLNPDDAEAISAARAGEDIQRGEPVVAGAAPRMPASGTGRPPGHTRVRSGALIHGLTGDLNRHPRVRRAAVALTGDATDPRMWARLDVKAGVDLAALHRYVADSLRRFTVTTGLCLRDVRVVVQVRDTVERVQ